MMRDVYASHINKGGLLMLMPCPVCGCKTRIVTSQEMTNETRKAYWQCLNFNCGVRFSTLTSVEVIIDTVGLPPDPKLQP